MSPVLSYQEITARLKAYHQEHVLEGFETLDPSLQSRFLESLSALDLELMRRLHQERNVPAEPQDSESISSPFPTPLPAKRWEDLDIGERAACQNLGTRLIREGKAAAFLVAGGQGTRLGMSGPKGKCSIGLPSQKSLFQLQAERLLNLSQKAGKVIPWAIMTSPDNHQETTEFFESHQHFGYPKESLRFFSQAELPVLNDEGHLLLKSPGQVSQGANGNGGCFKALAESGILAAWKQTGVEWVFFYAVDNALVKVCDPRFLGYAASQNLPVSSKAVARAHAKERVGVFGLRHGRPTVVEYSELPLETATATNSDGRLRYNAGNIAIHCFRIDFLEALAKATLPYHAAHKKIPYWSVKENSQEPLSPNAWKYELFMFDAFECAEGMSVLEVAREEEFAPVKNAQGEDSPETARNLLLQLHQQWALSAGFKKSELEEKLVEISPLTSYAGEGLSKDLFTLTDDQVWLA
jgi:UDP-N-acetylglucosamine pyrophosphorylase